MTEENKRVTKYLRKAILAQVDKGIDFKKEEFYRISQEDLITGNIEESITTKLYEKDKKERQKNIEEENEKNIDENLYVILATKVIKTQVEGTQKKEDLEDLTGIFFIPAMLNKSTSSLLPAIEDNKLPWFPREILKPMIEPELAIGDSKIYDEVVSDGIYNIYQITNWQEYIKYCKNIYEKTTTCSFESNEIYNINSKREKIVLEDNAYIFLDKTINPSINIKKLYNNITKQDIPMPLYENFIALKQANNRLLLENTIENKKLHYGQMEGRYGLSLSQRESLNHFNNIKNGEILVIQGPPGTGKTTLLQSIVASQYVKSALEKKESPLIVATSTNNQAVTNIIESFGKITSKYSNNLETRWIEKVNNFAIYFPSKQKVKYAKQKGFLYTNNKGEYSLTEIDSEENIKKSKEKYLKEAEKLFPNITQKRSIGEYKEIIHQELLNINKIQNNLISIVQELEELTGKETTTMTLVKENENKKRIKEENEQNIKRLSFLQSKYQQIPQLWKMLSFIKKYKIKISNNLKVFLNENEQFEESIINIDVIESFYANKTEKNNFLIREIEQKIEKIKKYLQQFICEMRKLKKYNIDDSKVISNKDELDI